MYVRAFMCHCTPVGVRGELAGAGALLHYMCLRHQPQVVKLDGKNLCLLSHLTGPIFFRIYRISDEIDLKFKNEKTSHSSLRRLEKHSFFMVYSTSWASENICTDSSENICTDSSQFFFFFSVYILLRIRVPNVLVCHSLVIRMGCVSSWAVP